MDEATARAMIQAHFDASNVGAAGGGPHDDIVRVMEFRAGKVVRERMYFGDPWEPPAWRSHWVEQFDPREPSRR